MSRTDLKDFLEFAQSLAAGAVHVSITAGDRTKGSLKADNSDVTATDLSIQRLTHERIRRRYSSHAFLGEEEGDDFRDTPKPNEARYCWVLDPLDGTRNYVRGLPWFGTSIALLDQGQPVVGVINNHVTGCTYSAVRGSGARSGARSGGRLMKVADNPFGNRTIVSFQPASDGNTFEMASAWLNRIVLRNVGSTALHLAMLADGNTDGALAVDCYLWDIAAGALMIEEAGGTITDLAGDPIFPFDPARDPRQHTPFVAGGQAVHARLLDGLR